MAFPLLALGAVAKFAKSPLGRKIGKGVGKGLGKVFGKRKQAGQPSVSSLLTNQPLSTNMAISEQVDTTQTGGGVAEKINDFLGRATKSTREVNVETGVSKQTMIFAGLALLLAYLLFKK